MATKKIKSESKKYIRAKGTRKRAVAVVRLMEHGADITINKKSVNAYFPVFELQKIVFEPLRVLGLEGKVGVNITTKGGGMRGQAEAIRHALSRAFVKMKQEHRTILKKAKLLARDAREKERKKFGLKRARKAPQWGKR